jgi:hypothetical protein
MATDPIVPPVLTPAAVEPVLPTPTQRPHETHPDLLILLHGIRDKGRWMHDVKDALEDGALNVVNITYDYISILRFLSPFSRASIVRYVETRVHSAIADHKEKHPEAKVSIVAHSFGCYVVSQLVARDSYLKFDKLVFCGSVLNGKYSPDILRRQVRIFVNDCGTTDNWPLVAGSITWAYGDTGTFGFHNNAIDRFHNGGHGVFFDTAFIDKYWKPLFHDGVVAKGDRSPDPRFYQRLLLVIRLRWFVVLAWLAIARWVLIPSVLWLLSLIGVEFSFLTIRHDYALPTVPATACYYNNNKGCGLVPPNSSGTVDADVIQGMYILQKWIRDGTKPAAGDQTKGVVVLWSTNVFPANYFTFSASVEINPAWRIVEGCAFLTRDRTEAGQYRPVYRQLDFDIPTSRTPLDHNKLELIKPDRGEKLLLILRVESADGKATLTADAANLGIGVYMR